MMRTWLGVVVGIAATMVSAPAAAQPLAADLAITKTGPATAPSGTNIAFTVTVSNGGPNDAQFVDMFETLPTNAAFVSFTQNSGPSGTINPPSGGEINVSWATFPSGQSAVFTVVVSTAADFTGTVTNAARVTADFFDPDDANNSATVDTRVAPEADLSVTKTGPANGAPGSDVSYTLTAINNGSNDATNVILSDTLPAGVTFVALTQNTGPSATLTTPPVGASGALTATWPTLANGSSATFTLTVNVGSGFSGALLNTATIAAATADPNTANNSSTASLAVTTSTTSTTTSTTTTTTSTTTSTTVASTTSTTLAGGLPATGRSSGKLQAAAIASLIAGLALLVVTRRRTHTTG